MRTHLPAVVLAALVLLAGAAYLPGLPGDFVLDDLHNIVLNPRIAIDRLDLASLAGAIHADPAAQAWPSRGIAHLSFALNHLAAGGRMDVGAIKATNIAIHLANGILVYALLAGVLRGRDEVPGAAARWVAVLAAGLWLLHPLQLTGVLYAVQRMTSLAATFTLLGLVVYCAGRRRLEQRPVAGLVLMAGGLGGGTLLGALTKENAVLAPLFALLLELWFHSLPGGTTPATRRRLAGFYGAFLVLPGLAGLLVTALYWERLLTGYAFRSFDVVERVLTQGRVLFYYLRWFVVPRTRDLSLFHDDIAISTGLFTPWTTAPALLLWAAVLGGAAFTFRRRPVLAFCALWYLGGHLVESTVVPLEIAFEHRNYLPLLGPCLALAWLLVRGVQGGRVPVRGAAAVAAAVMMTLGAVTAARASIWQDANALAVLLARNHPDSYRAHTEHARTLLVRGADPDEIYAALTRASDHPARPVLTLLEMIKLARDLELRIASGELAALDEVPPPPTGIAAPLRRHQDYLRRLHAILAAELEDRLATRPLGHESARGLELLRECVVADRPACVSMREEAGRWHRIAIDNPRSVAATRSTVLHSLALLLADEERYDEAAEFERRARGEFPRELGFGLYEALWLIRAGRMEEAGDVVRQMEAFHDRTGRRGDEVRRLRAAYDRARADAGTRP